MHKNDDMSSFRNELLAGTSESLTHRKYQYKAFFQLLEPLGHSLVVAVEANAPIANLREILDEISKNVDGILEIVIEEARVGIEAAEGNPVVAYRLGGFDAPLVRCLTAINIDSGLFESAIKRFANRAILRVLAEAILSKIETCV